MSGFERSARNLLVANGGDSGETCGGPRRHRVVVRPENESCRFALKIPCLVGSIWLAEREYRDVRQVGEGNEPTRS